MKNNPFKHANVFFSSFLIFILHLPFVFANTKPVESRKAAFNHFDNTVKSANTTGINFSAIYAQLDLNSIGLSEEVFNYAVKGYTYLKNKGAIENEDVLSIVDFTKPSSQKRLFIIDLKQGKTLFNTYVAHGQGSGAEFANRFSNIPESYQSSLGFYTTTDTYMGKHGYSLHLKGQENGINDKADERAIVVHGAAYVSENLIRSQGYIGRSWGCPAVPEKLSRPIIEKIKNGSCLFVFGKNKEYIRNSKILNS